MSRLTTRVVLCDAQGAPVGMAHLPADVIRPELVIWNRNVYRLQPERDQQMPFPSDAETPRYRQVFAWWATTDGG